MADGNPPTRASSANERGNAPCRKRPYTIAHAIPVGQNMRGGVTTDSRNFLRGRDRAVVVHRHVIYVDINSNAS